MKISVLSLKEKKPYHIGFPAFKLPASTKKSFMTHPINYFFYKILVYDYMCTRLYDRVQVFHKGIISTVLCG